MSYYKPYRRLMAMVLSIVMVLGMLPVSATAQELSGEISGEVISFEGLPEETANQPVALGTSMERLDLPGTLTAMIRIATASDAEVPEPDSGEPEPREPKQTTQSIPVTWKSEPEYDGNTVGVYTFGPYFEPPEELTLADGVSAPQISVTVGETSAPDQAAAASGEVTAFAALAEDIRWRSVEYGTAFEDLNLPQTLPGTVEGKEAEIPVTWEAEPDYDGQTKGLYLFTAVPGEGFTASAESPVVAVVVRGGAHSNLFSRGGGALDTDPFFIGSAAQLAAIAEIVNAGRLETLFLGMSSGTVYLKLENDIDLSGYTANGGWVPIGTYENRFKGSFDGGGSQIIGLTINRPGADFQGLFGYVGSGGLVQNLGVTDVRIISGNENLGGTGGVAGYVAGTVKNCYVTGSIRGGTKTGGVAGQIRSASTVQDCYSAADVAGTYYVGGVAGGSSGTVQSCYATGSVTGTGFAGGVGGDVGGTVKNCAALNSSVSDGGGSYAGRIAGGGSGFSESIAFAGMTVNGVTVSGGAETDKNGMPKTAVELQTAAGFPTALTAEPWTYAPGKLPGLNGQAVDLPAHLLGTAPFEGAGTSASDPYQITTAAQLAKLAELVNAGSATYNASGVCYLLMNDLNLSGYAGADSGKGWTPIGNTASPFKGSFDGNGYTITGLTINRSAVDDQGLFGGINAGSTVETLGIVGASILGRDSVGGVVGNVSGTVRNCYVTGSVSGRNNAGGVVGSVSSGVVQGCYTTAVILGTQSGSGRAGGVAGLVNHGSLTGCAALNPSVGGSYAAGRVAGEVSNSTLHDNIAFADMTVDGDTTYAHNGTPKSAADLQTLGAFPTELIFTPWTLISGRLPGLNGQTVALPAHLLGSTPFEGEGSIGNPYKIGTVAQLAKLAQLVNTGNMDYISSSYLLEKNLDLSTYSGAGGWTPIGNILGHPFCGRFYGGGHQITGLFISRPGTNDQGLFGYVSNAALVDGLGIVGANITGASNVGGIAGNVAPDSAGRVQNCYVTGNISGTSNVGGIAGSVTVSSGTVQNCYSAAAVSGSSNVGGVVGNVGGTVQYCYATGNVSSTGLNTGGVVGYVNGGTVQNCAALNATVTGDVNFGRVAGANEGGTLSYNCGFLYMLGGIWPSKGLNQKDGSDVFAAEAAAPAFWTTAANWDTSAWSSAVWTLENGKLPQLKNLTGQSGELPLHLVSFSTTPLTIALSGTGIGGSAPAYSAMTALTGRTITVTATGWADWTNKEVTVTVKAPDNSPLTVTPEATVNGIATFTLPGYTEGTFTVTAAAKSNPGNVSAPVTLVVTTSVIPSVRVTGLVAPAAGVSPATAANLAAVGPGYSVTGLTWQNGDGSEVALTPGGKFKAGSSYQAVIELTAAPGYKFPAAAWPPEVYVGIAAPGMVSGGDVTGNKLTFPVTFSATAAKTVTGIVIKTPPAKLTYTAGETLDLSGLAATLTYNDGSTEDVPFASFAGKDITANPANGTTLSVAAHNGNPVTLACNTHTDTTGVLTVNAAPIGAASVAITAPSVGAAPQTAAQAESATGNSGYTVSGLVWNEALTTAGKFKADQVYTATITLTSKNEKAFQSAAFIPTVAGAAAVGTTTTSGAETGNTVSFTVTFPATAEKAVTGIAVKTPPVRLIYTAGEALDLSGIEATLTYNDGSTEDVLPAGFVGKGITASPESGTTLATSHTKVTITHTTSGKWAEQAITVNSAPVTVTSVSIKTAPAKIRYTAGESLDLTGFAVTLHKSDSATEDVDLDDFTSKGITVSPANGTILGTGHTKVTITHTASGKWTEQAITVNSSSSTGNGGGDGGHTSFTPPANISTDKQPNMPTTANTSVSGKVKDSVLTAIITEQMAKDAIKAAQEAAKKSGKKTDGIALDFNITGSGSYTNLTATIEAGALDRLKEAGVRFLRIGSAVLDATFDTEAIAEMDKQSIGAIMVSAQSVTKLSDAAKKLIGSRPVFNITVSYQKNGKTETVSNFDRGAVTLGIAYKPSDKEKPGNLFGVYVDQNGKPQLLTNSSYADGRIIFERNSLSIYGVGYKAPAPAFSDTAKHWAKDSIDFVASRGLISGTTGATFAPNTAITRADFLMALGRLSGADVSNFKSGSFTDVKNDNTAMPYIEWAVKNKIVQGIGDSKFGPGQQISRQDMAVMMQNYAKATGYTLPTSVTAVTFSDNAKISAYAKDAVKAIQQAGIMQGKGSNTFDPAGNATRGEASAILRRFVELVIDEGTARGWNQNDAGQWQYIGENGKPVTGWLNVENGKYRYYFDSNGIMVSGKWLEIDGKWYYFNADGSLAKNAKIGEYEVDENDVKKNK